MIMKGQVMPAFEQMGKEALQHLVTEVKETVATEVKIEGNQKKFGAIDMWSSQRRVRQASGFLNKWQLS
jgi:hypothetical protein